MLRRGTLISAAIAAVILLMSVPYADAFTVTSSTDPLQNSVCFLNGCSLSGGNLAINSGRGEGILPWFVDEVTGVAGDNAAAAIEAETAGSMGGTALSLGIIDAASTENVMGGTSHTIANASTFTAFSANVREGSTQKSVYVTQQFSSNFALPSATSNTLLMSAIASMPSLFSGNCSTWGGGGCATPRTGSALTMNTGSSFSAVWRYNATAPAGGGVCNTTGQNDLAYIANTLGATEVTVGTPSGPSSACSAAQQYWYYFTTQQYDNLVALAITAYGAQTVAASYGWPNQDTWAGLQPLGSNLPVAPPTYPSANDPTKFCAPQSGVRHCALTGSSGSISDPTTFGTQGKNYARCVADPVDYVCPTISSGTFTGGTGGGAAGTTYIFPNVIGQNVNDAESVINSVLHANNWDIPTYTITVSSTPNPGYPAGAVIGSTPVGGTSESTAVTTVTLTTNPTTGGTGGGSAPGTGLDFSPLTGLHTSCSSFPFGLFCYMTTVLGWFNVSPEAPSFDLTMPAPSCAEDPVTHESGPGCWSNLIGRHWATSHYSSNLNAFSSYMSIVRTLESIALWVGAVWYIANKFWLNTDTDLLGAADDGMTDV